VENNLALNMNFCFFLTSYRIGSTFQGVKPRIVVGGFSRKASVFKIPFSFPFNSKNPFNTPFAFIQEELKIMGWCGQRGRRGHQIFPIAIFLNSSKWEGNFEFKFLLYLFKVRTTTTKVLHI
jgi:hypothetical protein